MAEQLDGPTGSTRRHRRFGVTALLVFSAAALVAAGWLSTEANPTSSAGGARPGQRPATAWAELTSEVQSGGEMSLAHALSAFALAVGPVPGSVVPKGPKGPIGSGTIAVNAVLRDWSLLRPDQQRAVDRDLGLAATAVPTPVDGSPGIALTALRIEDVNPNAACPTTDSAGSDVFVGQVKSIRSQLLDHIPGSSMPNPIYVEVNTKNVEKGAAMYTIACNGSEPAAGTESLTSCVIHVQPDAGGPGQGTTTQQAFFHEMAHCLLFETLGAGYGNMPSWYVEGVPEWVACNLAGNDEQCDGFWDDYLSSPFVSLFRRTYTAVGFYVQLQYNGVDVWSHIIPAGRALLASGGSNVAGWNAFTPSQQFLQNWGSGYAQGRYNGHPWTASSAGFPQHPQSLPSTSTVGNGGNVIVNDPAVAATQIRPINVTADVIQVKNPSAGATGLLSLGHGSETTLANAAGVNYCAKSGGCKCPPGEGTDLKFSPIERGTEYATVTGGLATASVTVDGVSLKQLCSAPCMVGTWTTTSWTSSNGAISGGHGIIWDLNQDGDVTVTYPGVSVTIAGAHIVYNGTATYTIQLPADPKATSGSYLATATGGSVTALENNPVAGPMTVPVHQVSHETQWTCQGDSMTLTIPISGVPYTSIYQLSRTSLNG